MTEDEYAAALRPRRKFGPTLMVFAACVLAGWLGWCGVLVARAARDVYVGTACADAGHDFAFGECRAPDIQVNVVLPKALMPDNDEPPRTPAPWGGQTPGAL